MKSTVSADEFAVLLKGNDYEQRESLLYELYTLQMQNQRQGLVTAAVGIAVFDSRTDSCMQDVFERADRAMYLDKMNFHK